MATEEHIPNVHDPFLKHMSKLNHVKISTAAVNLFHSLLADVSFLNFLIDSGNQYVNSLLEMMKPEPEFIETVKIGPFQRKVDTGLQRRKTAFECVY